MHPDTEYQEPHDEPSEHELPTAFVKLDEVIDFCIGREIEFDEDSEQSREITTVTLVSRNGKTFVIEARSPADFTLTLYLGNPKDRVTPSPA